MNIDIVCYNMEDYESEEQAFKTIPSDLEVYLSEKEEKYYQTVIFYIENPILILTDVHTKYSWFKSIDFIRANFILMLYKETVLLKCMPNKYMAISKNIIVERCNDNINLLNHYIVIDNISIDEFLQYFLSLNEEIDLFGTIIQRGFYDDDDVVSNHSYFYTNIPIFKSHMFISNRNADDNNILTVWINSLNRKLMMALSDNMDNERKTRLLEYFYDKIN